MTVVAEDDPRLVFAPVEKATTPPSGLIKHYKDYWWVVHPTKGIVYWRSGVGRHEHLSAQANRNEELTRRIIESMYPWAEARLIPSVFERINPNDYVFQ